MISHTSQCLSNVYLTSFYVQAFHRIAVIEGLGTKLVHTYSVYLSQFLFLVALLAWVFVLYAGRHISNRMLQNTWTLEVWWMIVARRRSHVRSSSGRVEGQQWGRGSILRLMKVSHEFMDEDSRRLWPSVHQLDLLLLCTSKKSQKEPSILRPFGPPCPILLQMTVMMSQWWWGGRERKKEEHSSKRQAHRRQTKPKVKHTYMYLCERDSSNGSKRKREIVIVSIHLFLASVQHCQLFTTFSFHSSERENKLLIYHTMHAKICSLGC